MNSRMNLTETDPGAAKAIFNLKKYVDQAGIPIRASQLNGCALSLRFVVFIKWCLPLRRCYATMKYVREFS
jgi:hypothetical protein